MGGEEQRARRLGIVATLGLGLAFAVAQIAGLTPAAFDAGAYWAAQPGALYQADWGAASGRVPFVYSPAFADALIPARLLPEHVFLGLWQLGLFALLALVLRGWSIVVIAVALPTLVAPWPMLLTAILSDIAMGNIHVLLGAVAVFGLRWPALWSIALLSKVTPGIGLVWFVARREWRNLAIALGVTALIAAASFAYRPSDWTDWIAFLIASRERELSMWVVPVPLAARLAMSTALLWWGGRTDRAWTVPIAVGWAIPIPYGTMLATMVCAVGARPVWRSCRPLRDTRKARVKGVGVGEAARKP